MQLEYSGDSVIVDALHLHHYVHHADSAVCVIVDTLHLYHYVHHLYLISLK